MEKELGYITSIIGDPVRTNVLWTLLDGRAYTASELATCANTSPQNMSMHLGKLLKADLLTVEKQGRHKYYKFSRHEVADAIEALSSLIPPVKLKVISENTDNVKIKYCRTCYDHLAGKVGVMIMDALVEQGIFEIDGITYKITAEGKGFFSEMDIDIDQLKTQSRAFIRPCLDWTERRHHLAGSLGAALLDKMLSIDWLRKTKNSRAISLTAKGQKGLYEKLKLMV